MYAPHVYALHVYALHVYALHMYASLRRRTTWSGAERAERAEIGG